MSQYEKIAYPEVVGRLLRQMECRPSTAYLRCLECLDEAAFVANSRLMHELAAAMFARPDVVAHRFKRHSEHETAGAAIIERVANEHAPPDWRPKLLDHARDEYKHGRMFAGFCRKLARLAACAPPRIERLSTAEHARAFDGDMANFMIATHVAELRNLAILDHYVSAARAAGVTTGKPLLSLLETIASDEQRHVTYTGALVNDLVADCEQLEKTFRRYIGIYDRESWHEIATTARLMNEPRRAAATVA